MRLALVRIMIQSSLATLVGSTIRFPLRARRAVFAPVLIATLSLASFARAQDAPANVEPSAPQATATPVSEAPAAPQLVPAAPAVAPATLPAPPAPPSDKFTQRPRSRVHEGFYLRLSTGPNLVTLRGHGPSGSASLTDSGAGGFIAIGGAIVPGLVLAGTLQGTVFDAEFKGGPFENATVSANGKTREASNRATGGFGMVGMLVDWYPQPKGGWHVGGSAGLGAVILNNSADDSVSGGANFAGSVFGGYDWSLGRNWGLGLQLVASGATKTKLEDDSGKHDTGYRLTPLAIGVQASLLYF